MPRIKAVTVAFLPLGEAAHAAVLAQGFKTLPPSGEQLVGCLLYTSIAYGGYRVRIDKAAFEKVSILVGLQLIRGEEGHG